MHALGIGRTDIGKERPKNEDALHVDNDLGLFIVSDGVGGHAAGDVAARMAVDAIAREVARSRSAIDSLQRGEGDGQEVADVLRKAIVAASDEVFTDATSTPDHAGMGCTVTALVFSGNKAIMGHVGDTRLYLVRGGEAHQSHGKQ